MTVVSCCKYTLWILESTIWAFLYLCLVFSCEYCYLNECKQGNEVGTIFSEKKVIPVSSQLTRWIELVLSTVQNSILPSLQNKSCQGLPTLLLGNGSLWGKPLFIVGLGCKIIVDNLKWIIFCRLVELIMFEFNIGFWLPQQIEAFIRYLYEGWIF